MSSPCRYRRRDSGGRQCLHEWRMETSCPVPLTPACFSFREGKGDWEDGRRLRAADPFRRQSSCPPNKRWEGHTPPPPCGCHAPVKADISKEQKGKRVAVSAYKSRMSVSCKMHVTQNAMPCHNICVPRHRKVLGKRARGR